ncbi:MAG: cobalamin-binding protein [Chloroflexi bacterium]|nr:cobalamin-binding protein [Chloroflexota bacterium]
MSSVLERLSTAVIAGDAENSVKLVHRALDKGMDPKDILDNGLVPGMDEVGIRFRRGDMFVPEVLMSADTMSAGLDILRPLLAAAGTQLIGTVVLGTVKGDLHDIGKNLVGMMAEGAGFEVIDIGFNVPPERFIDAIKEHQPNIIGMSAMLTTTMRAMGHTIRAIEEAGLRDKVKIIVGGAPVDAEFATRITADGYGSNAPSAVELCKSLASAS